MTAETRSRLVGVRSTSARRVEAACKAVRRSRHVRGRVSFVIRELRKSPRSRTYELRSGGYIHIRHQGVDAFLIEEILENQIYRIPEGARSALAALDREPRIVDLGANIGLASHRLLSEFPAGSVVGYEPDPDTASVLRRFVAENSLGDRYEVVEACAGPVDGEVTFRALGSPLSREVDPAQARENEVLTRLPQRDVFPHLERADLIKIDIEGAEWPILQDPRWPKVKACAVVLEFHARPHLKRPAVEEARDALEHAGYSVELRELRPAENGADATGVLWAWRTPKQVPNGSP